MARDDLITVKVHLKAQSQPVPHMSVVNTYTKDGLFCVLESDDYVYKYPVIDIFRVVEDYGTHRG